MRTLVFTCLLLAMVKVDAQPRGEMLYSLHCIQCHTTQIHWRDQRLARDWNTLRRQVGRWQYNLGLGWGDDDITAVTKYLNDTVYHFPHAESQAPTRIDSPGQSVGAAH